MRISVVAVGTRMPAWIEQGIRDYTRRLPREMPVRILPVAQVRRTRSTAPGRAVSMEAERIAAAVPAGARRIALDEQGRIITTRDLCKRLQGWMNDGTDPAFLIGGADGLDASILDGAAETWSLSPMTLPHGLARLLLIEQIYRAWSLLRGHPYHRE